MAVKPVKFISDVQTQKQIIKTDVSGNVLFAVSGTLPLGSVSSSLPITASGLYIDGSAYIIGAPLINLDSPGSTHNIASVFSAIDSKFANLATLSELHTGSFDADGSKNVQLTNYFYADLDYVYVDVMTKASGTVTYKNDLISVELSGNMLADKIHVIISAPALTNVDYYRIIANKQTGSL
jgi:hypothetical protein